MVYNEPTISYSARLTGIPLIKLPGRKQRTVLDERRGSINCECRQTFHQAHKTIRRRRELAFDGSR